MDCLTIFTISDGKMELLIIAVVGIIIIYIFSGKKKQARNTIYIYIILMALVFYTLFVAKDPFEGLPPYVADIINYAIIVGTLVGFYRQIEGSLRTDFNHRLESLRTDLNNRLGDLKQDLRRDIDRLEKRSSDIEQGLTKSK